MTHALAALGSGEARGAPPPPHDSGGAPTPMAVDPVEPPGAAAMRASDEMQQTTIGDDSDADGSDRPRAKARRRPQPGRKAARKAHQQARAEQAAAPAMGGGRTGEAARRDGSDDSDRD